MMPWFTVELGDTVPHEVAGHVTLQLTPWFPTATNEFPGTWFAGRRTSAENCAVVPTWTTLTLLTLFTATVRGTVGPLPQPT